MKSIKIYFLFSVLAVFSASSNAALVTFNAVGSADVSGYVTFDDSFFGAGTSTVGNTAITDLSLTVLGFNFSFADTDSAADTIVNNSGVTPVIVNGAGALASNGTQTIAFFPDGFDGTPFDGDASLALDLDGVFNFSGANWEQFFDVRWEVAAVAAVPEPSTYLLFGMGLLGLLYIRRRKSVS